MLGALEDPAAIGALALEHAAGVMQPVGQDVDLASAHGTSLPSYQITPSILSNETPMVSLLG